jgi:hypothetical protein
MAWTTSSRSTGENSRRISRHRFAQPSRGSWVNLDLWAAIVTEPRRRSPAMIRRALAALLLAVVWLPVSARAEENLYQKRDRYRARVAQIGKNSLTLTEAGQQKLDARRQLTKAVLRAKDEYFTRTLAMGTSVVMDHLLPRGGTLAKAILRKIVSGEKNGRFTNAQRESLRIVREMEQAISDLETDHTKILAALESDKNELKALQSDIERINRFIDQGPPGSSRSQGSQAAASDENRSEDLAPRLEGYFTAYMEGPAGNYRIEYTRPWQWNSEKSRFECNYRLFRIRPYPGRDPRTFREFVEVSNDNPLRPTCVTKDGARRIVAAGKWLR